MAKKQGARILTGRQKRYLRSLGHHLKPLVILGREGITDNVTKAAAAVLAAHELLKVKIGNGCHMDKLEAADSLAAGTGSQIIQILGKTFLLFRENPDLREEKRIRLPA